MDINIQTSLYNFMRDFHAKDGNLIALRRGSRTMTFAKFFKEIDKLAGGLYAMGVRKGDAVMLALPNIFQNVVAVYALSRIGAVAAMIHPLWSQGEFEQAFKKIKPKAVFLSDINLKKFYKAAEGAKRVICPYLAYGYIGIKLGGKFEADDLSDGEGAMFYMQSGGTSGKPKTIQLSSRAVNGMAKNVIMHLDDKFSENNRMLAVMPMFHGFGLCIGIHASLSTNMTPVLMSKFDVKKAAKTIDKYKVTNVLAVPRMVYKLLRYPKFKGGSLQEVYVGGDTVGDELVSEFDARMKAAGSNARLLPGYGLTETVTVCALTKGEFKEGSVGLPIGDTEAIIVDDDLNPLPDGERGELLLAGSQLMTCYYGDSEATDAVFVNVNGKKFVKTGDIFSRDSEGRLYFIGRKKRLIKISGMNVFPSDIESVVSQLDFVGECAAIEYSVDGKPYIRLLVEKPLSDAQKDEIFAHIKKNLSHWNMPKEILSVGEFPRTSVGKADVKKLEELYGGPQNQ